MGGDITRKQTLFLPNDILKEIRAEAARRDRSLSWVIQKAWRIAREDIMTLPSLRELFEGRQEATAAQVSTVPAVRTTLVKKEELKR